MSGRASSGSFGSGRTAGYAIGGGRTSPWLEAIAGIRERPYPRLGSKPVPAPRTRSEVRASLSVGLLPPRPQHAPPPERQKRCVGQGVCGEIQCAGQSNVRARCAGHFLVPWSFSRERRARAKDMCGRCAVPDVRGSSQVCDSCERGLHIVCYVWGGWRENDWLCHVCW